MSVPYDAVLLVSFGGPEHRDHVIPFLENVLRGRPVPRERMLEVAEHYYHFDGISPINSQCRELIAALKDELPKFGVTLPLYWGNRNWHPMLTDTLREMTTAGHKRVVAFVTSAYSSYSGCRQYRENILEARSTAGESAPEIDKIRVFYNHPWFIEANRDRIQAAIDMFPESERANVRIAFTAHSIPTSMANQCNYTRQLEETCRLLGEALKIPASRYRLVYQSRSGRPEDPWLEPDVCDHIESLSESGVKNLVISPVGFLSDHVEVLYDLDDEAAHAAAEKGITMHRAGTVGTHPLFVKMVASLIAERIQGWTDKSAVGLYPANHDVCPTDCCPAPPRARPSAAGGRP